MTDKESELDEIIHDVKSEIDPDGKGYFTAEAASLIFYKAKQGCGFLTNAIELLSRRGAVVALKEYSERFSKRKSTTHKDAVEAAYAGVAVAQRDFSEDAPGFDWIWKEVSLSEGHDAIRVAYGNLNLYDARKVYDLLSRKGRETMASAARVMAVMDLHPEWDNEPLSTMSEILLGKKPNRK